MATVTGLTAARALQIEQALVAGGSISASGLLILTKKDGSSINIGQLLAAHVGLSKVQNKGASNLPTADTFILRDANGRAQVSAPQQGSDIVTKDYVDAQHGDTGWSDITMNATWTHSTNFSWNRFRFRMKNSYVTINGRVANSAAWNVGDTVGTIPLSTARPDARVLGNGMVVQADGTIITTVAGSAGGELNLFASYPV